MKNNIFLPSGFIILIIGAAVLFFSILAGCNTKKNNLTGDTARGGGKVPVEVMVAEPQHLVNEIYATGSVLANEKVELRNEIPGRITGIHFEEGRQVDKGRLLLKINDSELKAQLNKIEANEKLAEQEVFRKRKLLDVKAISLEEYDVSHNHLKTIRADKELILAQIAKTEIYAPFSGRIGLRYVSPGSYIAANSLIANLQQTDTVKIEFAVSEKYSNIIKNGMGINFTVENSPKIFEGKIYAVETSVNPQTRTITARAISSNPTGDLIPGTFARVSIVLERLEDALLIPSEALSTEIEGSFLYLCKNGRAISVKVTPGLRTSRYIRIAEGIQAGDSIVITGLLQVQNGTPLNPKPATTSISMGIE